MLKPGVHCARVTCTCRLTERETERLQLTLKLKLTLTLTPITTFTITSPNTYITQATKSSGNTTERRINTEPRRRVHAHYLVVHVPPATHASMGHNRTETPGHLPRMNRARRNCRTLCTCDPDCQWLPAHAQRCAFGNPPLPCDWNTQFAQT